MLYRSTAPGERGYNNGYVANCEVALYRSSDHHEVARVKANPQGRFTMTVIFP